MTASVSIVGGGLCGNLLAILLARRGLTIRVFEREPAPDDANESSGRSINLALAARGIRALEQAQAFHDIEPLLLPMHGRILHEAGSTERFLAYGQTVDECIWSVSRRELNETLAGIAGAYPNVEYRFGHRCVGFDAEHVRASIAEETTELSIQPKLLLAADGTGSIIRRELAAAGFVTASEELLDHGYKELVIGATSAGDFALSPRGLHIWPRGGFMLIALPNRDRSFTATLFLPHRGQPGFDTIDEANVTGLFREYFPDAVGLIPNLSKEYAARPTGTLGTVTCSPWHLTRSDGGDRTVILLGDAAHGIVPFHGQGMNAAFEDCVELDRLIGELGPDWQRVGERFDAARREHARAIAEMALENYEEMRDTVRDPDFERRAALSFALEKRFPGRFIPRYSMVMFHPEIGYAEAQRRGRIQAEILTQAVAGTDWDLALSRASSLVERML